MKINFIEIKAYFYKRNIHLLESRSYFNKFLKQNDITV